jgi:hypothetical protein
MPQTEKSADVVRGRPRDVSSFSRVREPLTLCPSP